MSIVDDFLWGDLCQEEDFRKIKSLIQKETSHFLRDNFVFLDSKENKLIVLGNLICSEKEIIKLSIDKFLDLIYIEDRNIVLQEIEKLLKDVQQDLSVKFRITNRSKWVQLNLKKISKKVNDRVIYCGVLYDITNEVVLSEKIEHLIEVDELTKLPSSYYIKDKINERILDKNSKDNTGALILININHFKTINDSFNHSEGDLLLANVSARLLEVIDNEDLICRYSGDEFIIFKPLVKNKQDLKSYILKIKKCFNKEFKINNNNIYIDISIGIALTSENGETFNELLKYADFAMTKAKSNKIEIYEIFNESFEKDLKRTYSISQNLRNALEMDELFVVFQPKVLVRDFTVNGFEVLLRWNNRELGLVSVTDFIPIAENTRLIIPIGRFVLEESFKKVRQLLNEGYNNFKIAVNFSEIQLRYGNVVEDFMQFINKYKVGGKYIEIEITESILAKAFKDNIKKLQQIQKLGVTIALDDFGTGYSSLSYLTKLPIDVLKIDRSFITNIVKGDKDKKIVETMINLAHQLNIDVVAEGVEFKEQVDYLKRMSCDIIQGFYFGEPKEFYAVKNLLGKKLYKC